MKLIEIRRLADTLKNGRIGELVCNVPALPSDPNYICAPSTYRVQAVEKTSTHFLSDEQKERGKNLQRLLQSSQSGHQRNTKRNSKQNSKTRCFAKFECSFCHNEFSKNTLYLCSTLDGEYVDPLSEGPPKEQCSLCQHPCTIVPESCKQFDYEDARQHCKEHTPEICPWCIKLGYWCGDARRLSKRTPEQYDKSLEELDESDVAPKWITSPEGLTLAMIYQGREYEVTMSPFIFCIAEGKQKLVWENSLQAGLLIRDNAPERIETF